MWVLCKAVHEQTVYTQLVENAQHLLLQHTVNHTTVQVGTNHKRGSHYTGLAETTFLWDGFWGLKHHYKILLQSWHGKRILFHFMPACTEISVHRHWHLRTQGIAWRTDTRKPVLLRIGLDHWPLRSKSARFRSLQLSTYIQTLAAYTT